MSDHPGMVFPMPALFAQDLSTSLQATQPLPGTYNPLILDFAGTPHNGLFGHTGSTPNNPKSGNVSIMPTFADVLFNHIIAIPSFLAMGNLLSNQTRQIELANFYSVPKDLGAVGVTGDTGLTFTSLPSLPHTLLPFGNLVVQVGISTTGPAQINATLQFFFTYTVELDVPVTGTRIILFAFPPQTDVKETLEWKTDILEAFDATEQRFALRSCPRQLLEFDVISTHQVDTLLRESLFDWFPRVFGLPIWHEQREMSTGSNVGDVTFNVPTDSGDFRVGGLVFLYQDDTHFEAIEIQALTSTTITTLSQSEIAYPKGSAVMPARTALANTQTSRDRYPATISHTAMKFTVLDNVNLADLTGWNLYQSLIILDDPNLVSGTTPEGFQRPVTAIDNETAPPIQLSRTDRSRINMAKRWEPTDRAAIWKIRKLMHALNGNQTAFWLPSFRDDLVVTETIAAGGTTVNVQNVSYTNLVKSRRPMADLRLVLTDGRIIVRQITGSAEAINEEEIITVSSPFDAIHPILVPMVVRLEILFLVRLADDKATFTHHFAGDAAVDLNLTTTKG